MVLNVLHFQAEVNKFCVYQLTADNQHGRPEHWNCRSNWANSDVVHIEGSLRQVGECVAVSIDETRRSHRCVLEYIL